MFHDAYTLAMPDARTTSVIFASPHSGRDYPESFLQSAALGADEVRSSEDAFVDLLYADAPRFGAPLLTANAPRAYLDLNRGPQEMDAALVEGVRRVSQNPRVASGLGVVPRVVAGGRSIYKGKISLAEAHHRIARFWHPYHDALKTLIDESYRGFGQAILIDCHSMPHEALVNIRGSEGTRPDVVLGDRFGAAASGAIVEHIEAAFGAAGLRVARNMPFAGAYIVQHYGRPSRKQHAVQIEIDRALYMNEATLELNDNFAPLRALLSDVMREITELGRETNAALAAQ
tara:strand:- start:1064 stop:1927 length:864 start_codon:yes stop_codon:yes gene_type:complete